MKILAVSDVELNMIYSPSIVERFRDVNMIVSCGDLPYYYLEYMVSMLDVPMYYVRGNHASKVEFGSAGERSEPWGGVDLHRRVCRDATGLLMAGIEGSLLYNFGPHQYSQAQMWLFAFALTPRLFYNKLRYGRYLDILITHASPWKIHDMPDRTHRGAKAFGWLIKTFKPAYHLHGHIHIYRPDTVTETQVDETRVLNVYGYKIITLNAPYLSAPVTPSRSHQ